MNKRQKKKKWDKIYENRLQRFVELTIRIQVQNDIVQRRSNAPQDDILRTFLNGIEQEMTDIMYDMNKREIKRYY